MSFLRKIYWLLKMQGGFDPVALFKSLRALPHFFFDFLKFKSKFSGEISFFPCLQDKYEVSGATNSEYFWQDLLVAKMIFADNPKKHLDIGSRIDGFVAHLASFRSVDVMDIRPNKINIPSINFIQADLTKPVPEYNETYESVSCLHSLEHFGLGRYGDEISVNAYKSGFKNIAKTLKPNGLFYLSVPIGRERVNFNANWIFSPTTIIGMAEENHFELRLLTSLKIGSGICEITNIEKSQIEPLSHEDYLLGIFVFRKKRISLQD